MIHLSGVFVRVDRDFPDFPDLGLGTLAPGGPVYQLSGFSDHVFRDAVLIGDEDPPRPEYHRGDLFKWLHIDKSGPRPVP